MRTPRWTYISLAVVALTAMAGPVLAVTKDWQLSYEGYGNNNLWAGQSRTIYYGSSSRATYVGAFDMKVLAGPAGHPDRVWTYCIDLTNVANNDWYARYEGVKAPDSPGGTIPTMTDRAWQDLAWLNHHFFDESLTSKNKSSGFQLAVWDVLFGSDYSLAENTSFWAADFGAYGQGYLNALSSARASAGFVDYTSQTVFYVDGQSQMGKNTVVPEFAAAALAPMGVAAIGFLRRRLSR